MADPGAPENNGTPQFTSVVPTNKGGRKPGKRNRDKVLLQERIQRKGLVIFNRLMHWVNSADPMASMAAIKLAMAYGWGKPPEKVLLGNMDGKPFVVATPNTVGTLEQWDQLVKEAVSAHTIIEHEPDADHV